MSSSELLETGTDTDANATHLHHSGVGSGAESNQKDYSGKESALQGGA
jgi:hypothetical protein